jgi:hypothetical protein
MGRDPWRKEEPIFYHFYRRRFPSLVLVLAIFLLLVPSSAFSVAVSSFAPSTDRKQFDPHYLLPAVENRHWGRFGMT